MTKLSRVHDRTNLVEALTSVMKNAFQAQQFLEGLSRDELRYIADYFGASVLDPDLGPAPTRAAAARRVERFQRMSAGDSRGRTVHESHKMILLLEFVSLSQSKPQAFAARAGAA